MNEQEIKSKLDSLANYQAHKALLDMDKQALIDKVITPEIKKQIADIESEFVGKSQAVNENISALESEIRQAVLTFGTSVKGAILHAVYSAGRVSWDTKSLDGYAAAHPEIAAFKKQGDPSVSLRPSK